MQEKRHCQVWLRRPIQLGWEVSAMIEALRRTVQEGHCAILTGCGREEDKGQRARVTMQKDKAPQGSSCSLWHWGMDMGLDRRFWWGAITWNDNMKPMNLIGGVTTHSGGAEGQWRHRQQIAPQLPSELSGGSPSSGGNSLDGQSECSSWHSNQTRVSRERSQLGKTRRGFRV